MGAIQEHLESVYGREKAEELYPRIQGLFEVYFGSERAEPLERERLPVSQRDALLISYGDQVREPGRAPLQSLGEFAEQLLQGVVSGVHILPFYPSSSDDGFSVIDYKGVDAALGNWEDVGRIGRHFELMFDAVFNHVSVQSDWFQRFIKGEPRYRDYFVTVEGEPDLSAAVRPRALPLLTKFETAGGEKKVWTTFSADQADVNVRNPAVLLELLDALLFYVSKGARFIRLDAIAFLWKEIGTPCIHLPQTHRLIQLMRSVLNEAPGETMLITETNVPHAANISYWGDGRNEAQLVYNFALPPLVLHAFMRGDASWLARWARGLKPPTRSVSFFNFLASHDGIGVNPVRGILPEEEIEALVARTVEHSGFISHKRNPDGTESPYEMNISYFDALSNPNDPGESLDVQVDRFVCAHAVMLGLAGVPGIYFHSMFGSRNDRAGAEESGIWRRINRRKLSRFELEAELADPASIRARVFSGLKKMLAVRARESAFDPAGEQRVLECDRRLFALERVSPDGRERVLCLQNVSKERFTAEIALNEPAGDWRDLLTGKGLVRQQGQLRAALSPYEVIWARRANASSG